MKIQIYYLLFALFLIAFDIYFYLNYNKLLERQYEGFHLGEEDIGAKKHLELRQKIFFAGTIFGAVFFLLEGFALI